MNHRTPPATPPYKRPVHSKYGSPMGRRNLKPQPHETHPRCRLTRVHLTQGYDDGGAYWGEPNTLWCAWSPCGEVEIYARAPARDKAVNFIRIYYPQLQLLRR